jgi:hypothetical protein
MHTPTPPEFYRSEAFAEDLRGFVAQLPPQEAPKRTATPPRWASLLPLAVALLGVAFAVLPPST